MDYFSEVYAARGTPVIELYTRTSLLRLAVQEEPPFEK